MANRHDQWTIGTANRESFGFRAKIERKTHNFEFPDDACPVVFEDLCLFVVVQLFPDLLDLFRLSAIEELQVTLARLQVDGGVRVHALRPLLVASVLCGSIRSFLHSVC